MEAMEAVATVPALAVAVLSVLEGRKGAAWLRGSNPGSPLASASVARIVSADLKADGVQREEVRRFARELDRQVRAGQGIDGRSELTFVVGYLRLRVSQLAQSLGRMPTLAELVRELAKENVLGGIHPATLVMLIQADPTIRLADAQQSRPARPRRAAERRLNLALRFLPDGERERYRREWKAEMAAMPPAAAAQFAYGVLRQAPWSGVILWLCKKLGRLA
ncbi:hypothetical protein DBP19_35155 [Streptomyces sp. CS090A]|uniref:hypothetical protein n=1 Tax=Streptomyces sp. CS090A TaxID=2162710 RepID=UPI000D522EC0|nr:hypothetical protein [Streptomyces sp. CS090A]PVC80744.1 hypothetical protein DBP19_35155 [Streptomyces sp. CS090A]